MNSRRKIVLTLASLLFIAPAIIFAVISTLTSFSAVEPASATPTVEVVKQPPKLELYHFLTVEGIIEETNAYRATKGLPPLAHDPLLDQSATLKAQDMVAKNYWSHYSPEGTSPWHWFGQVGYSYLRAGENLGYHFHSNEGMVRSWKYSAEHEANLSGDYNEIGVGIVKNVDYQDKKNSVVIVAHYGKQ